MQFIRGLEKSEKDQAIAGAIIRLAKSLRMKVLAEGVETPKQLAYLIENSCDEVQGYYYYKPMPCEAVEEALMQDSALKAN
jgi:EAL domain-containing protein (putative c-di-GMP-specific phosphodiesterase class I)